MYAWLTKTREAQDFIFIYIKVLHCVNILPAFFPILSGCPCHIPKSSLVASASEVLTDLESFRRKVLLHLQGETGVAADQLPHLYSMVDEQR